MSIRDGKPFTLMQTTLILLQDITNNYNCKFVVVFRPILFHNLVTDPPTVNFGKVEKKHSSDYLFYYLAPRLYFFILNSTEHVIETAYKTKVLKIKTGLTLKLLDFVFTMLINVKCQHLFV